MKRPDSRLSYFSLPFTTDSEENFSNCISKDTIGTSFESNCSHSASISRRIQSSSSLSAKTRYRESVSLSNSSILLIPKSLLKKLYYSSSIRSFGIWKVINPTRIGSLCLFWIFVKSYPYDALCTWYSFLTSWLLIVACVLLSQRYFVRVCWPQSMLRSRRIFWQGSWFFLRWHSCSRHFLFLHLLLTISKLLKHFFRMYSTKRCILCKQGPLADRSTAE